MRLRTQARASSDRSSSPHVARRTRPAGLSTFRYVRHLGLATLSFAPVPRPPGQGLVARRDRFLFRPAFHGACLANSASCAAQKEFFLFWSVLMEPLSALADTNFGPAEGSRRRSRALRQEGSEDFGIMHILNGYLYGNMPPPVLATGERVRWCDLRRTQDLAWIVLVSWPRMRDCPAHSAAHDVRVPEVSRPSATAQGLPPSAPVACSTASCRRAIYGILIGALQGSACMALSALLTLTLAAPFVRMSAAVW